MAKKEFKIGDTFGCYFFKLRVNKEYKPNSCEGCFWRDMKVVDADGKVSTTDMCRGNKAKCEGVIFVKVE